MKSGKEKTMHKTAFFCSFLFIAGILDFLTTNIGLSKGAVEADGIYIPFIGNLTLIFLTFIISKFVSRFNVNRHLENGIYLFFLILAFSPVINNIYIISLLP